MNIVRYNPTVDSLNTDSLGSTGWMHRFGGEEARLSITPGDVVELFTEDCFGGAVKTPQDLPSQVISLDHLNPAAGPFHVEGAEPGDTLAVHFINIVPARPYAISSLIPHFGTLSGTRETALLTQALPEKVWFYELDLERWVAIYRAVNSDFTIELPLDPMYGTVGVAPAAGESQLTLVPSAHGGNMDTPELRAGTTLYLPVNVTGALLGIGDGHARQGEGESAGTGLECAMNSAFTVDVIKNSPLAWPRLENDHFIMSTGSTRPLEDAYRISQKDLVEWVSELLPLDTYDAYQLVSQMGTAPVANVCDPNYTFVSKFPKQMLRDAPVYQNVHARLRALADEYQAAL